MDGVLRGMFIMTAFVHRSSIIPISNRATPEPAHTWLPCRRRSHRRGRHACVPLPPSLRPATAFPGKRRDAVSFVLPPSLLLPPPSFLPFFLRWMRCTLLHPPRPPPSFPPFILSISLSLCLVSPTAVVRTRDGRTRNRATASFCIIHASRRRRRMAWQVLNVR